MAQNQSKTNTHAKEKPKIGLFGKLAAFLIVVGFILLFVVAFTNFHHEGMVGYIFQWLMAFYFLALCIGVLVYLVKNWKSKAWYKKILYFLGVLLTAFLSFGFFTTSFLDLAYVNEPLSTRLTSLELDTTYSQNSPNYHLSGRDSSGTQHEFRINSMHHNEARELQEEGKLNSAEIKYLPNTKVVMELSFGNE